MKTLILAVIVAIVSAKTIIAGVDAATPTVMEANMKTERAIEEATK